MVRIPSSRACLETGGDERFVSFTGRRHYRQTIRVRQRKRGPAARNDGNGTTVQEPVLAALGLSLTLPLPRIASTEAIISLLGEVPNDWGSAYRVVTNAPVRSTSRYRCTVLLCP